MNDELKAELDQYLKAWGKAIVANDTEAISRFSSDDWVIVSPEAGAIESNLFLDAVRSGDLTHDTFEVEVQRVVACGNAAVAVAHVKNSGAYQGTAFTADEWATDVFVRKDGGWTCVVTALTPRTGTG
jgi:ketosteroid isomerase-like protein